MTAVLADRSDEWPTSEAWKSILPGWFVDACADEMSQSEALDWLDWWRGLPPQEQRIAEEERRWALADWLHWLQPDERQWFWWDAAIEGKNRLRLDVEVSGWPAALGALEWLLRVAGVRSLTIEEEPVID